MTGVQRPAAIISADHLQMVWRHDDPFLTREMRLILFGVLCCNFGGDLKDQILLPVDDVSDRTHLTSSEVVDVLASLVQRGYLSSGPCRCHPRASGWELDGSFWLPLLLNDPSTWPRLEVPDFLPPEW